MSDDRCDRCGGSIDADHPTTCSACRYELYVGRSFEWDVQHDTLVQWVWSAVLYGSRERKRPTTGA